MSIPDTVFTLDKAKAHLRVTHTDEDDLITAMLDAAVASVERTTRRALTARDWIQNIDASDVQPSGGSCGCGAAHSAVDSSWVFHALLSPATVLAVTSYDPAGNETVLPADSYYMRESFGHNVVHVKEWPGTQGTEGIVAFMEWEATPDGGEPPADLYAAVMLTLGDLYENREAQVGGMTITPNRTVDVLLRSHVLDLYV